MKFKEQGKQGLFDNSDAIERMSEMGNSLKKLLKVVDFEMFRPLLEKELSPKEKKYRGGARPYDYVMMFKITILQRLFNLSDKQVNTSYTRAGCACWACPRQAGDT